MEHAEYTAIINRSDGEAIDLENVISVDLSPQETFLQFALSDGSVHSYDSMTVNDYHLVPDHGPLH